LELDETGNISGTPIQSGEFRFTVAASDSELPARKVSRDFTLRVISPLELAWGNFPGVEGNVIKGSVKVSNASKDDFDLTVIVVAVNEIGKAFALGYQRFSLKQAVADFEIPFSSSLPQGSYVVHADAVAEIPAKDAIYRRRLQTPSPLAITTGP
jgi:hypothetical protein